MLARRTPLRSNKPMRRSRSKAATAAERRHMGRVAAMGCLVCGAASTVHHVTAGVYGGRLRRSDTRVVPLCPIHHQKVFDPLASNPVSVEGLGHGGFYRKHGIDLLVVAHDLWARSVMEEQHG